MIGAMQMSRTRKVGWLGALVVALAAHNAAAEPTAQERKDANMAQAKAKGLVQKKQYKEAIDVLKEAQKKAPSAQIQLDLARAQIAAKMELEGVRTLEELLSDAKGKAGNKLVVDKAQELLKQTAAKLPGIEVRVSGPSKDAIKATIDGRAVELSQNSPVEAGEHTVAASAEGYGSEEKKVAVSGTKHEVVELKLKESAAAAAPTEAKEEAKEEAPAEEGASEDSGKKGSLVPAIVAFSVGGVGLGVGGAFGALAFSKTKKVKDSCDGNSCPADEQDNIDKSKMYGNISTVGFVVGGVGVATGVVLLLLRGSGDSSEAEASAHISPWIGPRSAGFVGTF